MSTHTHAQTVPKAALIGAAFLILFTIGIAARARSAHLAAGPSSPVSAAQVSFLQFVDRPDGSIGVIDATSGREVAAVPAKSNGFIRGVLRGMFRGRKLESLGHAATFTLARGTNGRLTLEDPQIGRRIELDSFGPTNSAAFAALLAAAQAR
jgi:putative photosynthetic complex assembly protein